MESLTKNKKTTHEIVQLLKESLGLEADAAAVSELTEGSFNAVYKIVLNNGARYVLKIAPNPEALIRRNEKEIMSAEVEALRFIKKQTAVPAPEVLCYSKKSSCCDSPFLIMQWMNGEDYLRASNDYSQEERKDILFELGAMTCDFHQIHGAAFGLLGEGGGRFPKWSEAFSSLFQNTLEDGVDAKVTLPVAYDALIKLEEKAIPFLNDVVTPCLIHGDLWMGNVLVHNGKISALLDFERSLWGDPLMEYPFGLLRNNADFLKGYQHSAMEEPDFSMQLRRALYTLYHYLIVIIEKPYRGFKTGASDYFVNQKLIAQVKLIENLFSR